MTCCIGFRYKKCSYFFEIVIAFLALFSCLIVQCELGGNAILVVSMVACKAGTAEKEACTI